VIYPPSAKLIARPRKTEPSSRDSIGAGSGVESTTNMVLRRKSWRGPPTAPRTVDTKIKGTEALRSATMTTRGALVAMMATIIRSGFRPNFAESVPIGEEVIKPSRNKPSVAF
jgi:hypothetical protein